MHRRTAGIRRNGFGDELVVIPFDVIDAKFADELVHGAIHIGIGVGIGQVDDLLGAPLHRQTTGGGLQDPIRMRAEHVGIGVDHFRLEPQAELKTLAVHIVGERLQRLVAVRPHLLRNLPVAEAGSVITARAEPTVIHHKAFHTAFHGLVGQCGEGVVVVVEIDGLPSVEDDRTRLGGDAVLGVPVAMRVADERMESKGDFVEPLAKGSTHPWGRVFFAAGQRDFTAEKHFAAAEHTGGVRQSLRGEHAVAAPCDMCGIDVATGESKAGFAEGKQQGRIEIRATGHRDLFETTDGQRLTLRRALTQMMAGGGEDFGGVGRHGEAKFHLADFEQAVAGVDYGSLLAYETAHVDFAGPDEFHTLFHVFGGGGDGRRPLWFGGYVPLWIAVLHGHLVDVAVFHGFGLDVGDGELAEQLAAVATDFKTLGADPGFGLGRQHARPCSVVERTGDALRTQGVV